MKHDKPALFLTAAFYFIFFAACVMRPEKVIFRPDTANTPQKKPVPFELWEILRSQNGGPGDIPEWARLYIDDKENEIEALDVFEGKYVFIGANGGGNFNALQQWANGFTVEQDLPGLVTLRAETRLVTAASLYPDDEYGDFFEFLIRDLSDAEYYGAVKEQSFWLSRAVRPSETDDADTNPAASDTERYEFLILVSVDKETLQKQIQNIIANVKVKEHPTKEQAAAVARIKNNFFEGF